ncbi:MAG: hypothetical protein WDA27_03210 [Actinomycetota bacterium]
MIRHGRANLPHAGRPRAFFTVKAINMVRKLAIITAAGLVLGVFPLRASGALAAPEIRRPVAGSFVSAGPVVVSGLASSSSTIDVVDVRDGRVLATATAASGEARAPWSVTVPLGDGAWSIRAVERGEALVSDSVSFTADGVRPFAPRIDTPSENGASAAGTPARVTGAAADDRGVLAVQLDYWLLNQLVRRVNAECACGQAQVTFSDQFRPTAPGYYVVKATTYDRAGNRSDPTSRAFATFDFEAAPATPELTEVPPEILSPDTGTILGGSAPTTVKGSAPPGARVELIQTTAGSGEIDRSATTIADPRTGKWTISHRFGEGEHTISAQSVDSKGRVSPASAAVTFFVDATKPGLRIETASDDLPMTFLPGQPIELRGMAGDDLALLAVQLDYWYLDKLVLRQNAVCECSRRTQAVWVDRPALSMPGYYHVEVRAIDVAGNRSTTGVLTFIKAP